MSIVPVNYRKQDNGAEAIARDVDYALSIADSYVQRVPGGAAGLVGRRVLELGPGYSLGTAVLLACHGARVTAADRYLAPWDPDYHPVFLHALLARLAATRRELSPAPLLALLAAGDFVPPALASLHVGSEDLDEVLAGSFDFVVSNAVFEHVENVPRALESLARITRRGGCGIHQVDFRDHRDFAHPLEYLTLAEDEFQAEFQYCRGECGNRWRHVGMGQAMERAGFEVLDFTPNMFADEAYLADLRPRLHREQRGLPEEALRVISGCFVLRRTAAPMAEVEAVDVRTVGQERARRAFALQFAATRRVLELRGAGAGRAADLADEESRALLEAGATEVVALSAALGADGLPRPDGSADLVLCLHALEHAPDRAALVGEVRRVLSADGLALFSVPGTPATPAGVDAAGSAGTGLQELVTLLADFEWVEFFLQAESVVSAVLPLVAEAAPAVRGSIEMPAGAPLGDPATSALLALCRHRRPVASVPAPPAAVAYGPAPAPVADSSAVAADAAALALELSASLHEHFVAANRLRWAALDAGLSLPE